ncbi:MAG: flagellar motor switch protein FliG, partial [Rhodocyclaceae bacterium]|nr:flagellar motor switch protein FliG [Rhodocyclaceae bacterium]
MDEQGLVDSAILLMSIGEEQAAEVFKFLAPKEVQKLGETMARLRTVDKEKVESVLTTFAEHANSAASLVSDS